MGGVEMEGINVASVMAPARPNEGQPAIFVIKFRSVLLTTVSLMVFSFVFCILWTLKYNQNSTYTHCEVDNFAPSISAAIGSFIPQKYVWQTCIAIHTAPRFLFVSCYNALYHQRLT